MRLALLGVLACALLLSLPGALVAQEAGEHGGGEEHGGEGQPAAPSPADKTARTERVWAAVGLTQNPVAFCLDPRGNIYVAESARAGQAVSDTRQLGHLNGVEEDLQMTSVEDRLAQIQRWTESGAFDADYFTRTEDRVRLVRDTDGDGEADESTVFAGGFNDPLDGIGAGLLWLDGGLYYTCIPHVWRLEDRDGDGDADEDTAGERVSLSYGYGIRWAFYGHDLHGLVMGPDGRIYFSMGDRGFNVVNQEGENLRHVERGAVLRMWPDGSGLEVFHVGLRNPQELAFDAYGNLYTGDNNCDAGDKARFVHLVEGGDSGWHQDVQSLPDRGPWMRERMWELRREKTDPTQPAWLIPPIAHVGHGPSGLAHYSGTGDSYPMNGSFLMADFPGGVRHIVVEPDGAWSRVASVEMAVSGKDVTDVAWGYDGRAYMSEWGGGWGPNPNGYIFTMTNDAVHADAEAAALIAEVQTLFAEGFEGREAAELVELLGHADQRVRLHAQYELSGRGLEAANLLDHTIVDMDLTSIHRIHAVWTLGMIARKHPSVMGSITDLMGFARIDADDELRAQCLKTLGDLRAPTSSLHIAALEDPCPRCRYYAAIGLGRTGAAEAIPALMHMLAENDNEDPMLRHAGSYALSLMPEGEVWRVFEELMTHGDSALATTSVQLGVVLAMRRNADPRLAHFLRSPDPLVAAEAARAIYDMQVDDAMPALAGLIELAPGNDYPRIEPILRRAIEANAQLGGADAAARLALLAAVPTYDPTWRKLALQELDGWDQIKNREGVWGHWRPRPAHDVAEVQAALAEHIDAIDAASSGDDELAALAAAMRLKHVTVSTAESLAAAALDPAGSDLLRRTAVDKLAAAFPADAADALAQLAEADNAPDELKNHARALLSTLDASAAQRSYLDALAQGSAAEQQQAITQLATIDSPEARAAINDLSLQLKRGQLDPALRLETYLAARDSADPQVAGRAQDYFADHARPGDTFVNDALLVGGDTERGRALAYENENANCLRCHGFAEGDGGGAVGPMLDHIGSDYPPAYLLQAMLDPGSDIADGYQSVSLTLADGGIKAGRIVSENTAVVQLANADGEVTEIAAINITKRTPQTTSLMPTMADRLSAYELRDLVAYLTSLQDARGPAPADGSRAPAASVSGGHASGAAGPGVHNPMAEVNTMMWLPILLLVGVVVPLGGFMLFVFFLNYKP